jgi:hypothetical protein
MNFAVEVGLLETVIAFLTSGQSQEIHWGHILGQMVGFGWNHNPVKMRFRVVRCSRVKVWADRFGANGIEIGSQD